MDRHGNKLREDGTILFPGAKQPIAYSNAAELMDLLAGSDRVRESITRKVVQFALGRPLVAADEPMLAEINRATQEQGGTYARLISQLTASPLVMTTRTESPSTKAPQE